MERLFVKKLSSVQALRALAALMVVILHSNIMFSAEERKLLLTIPGFTDIGYYGVQLFLSFLDSSSAPLSVNQTMTSGHLQFGASFGSFRCGGL